VIETFCGTTRSLCAEGLFLCQELMEAMKGMNRLKTMALLAVLTALLLVVGQALGGQVGLAVAIIFAALLNFGSYWFSDRIVLRMYRAQEVTDREAPELHTMVRKLSERAGLPMPKVYIIPEDAPNAFATGRNPQHGVVAVTAGLMRMLSPDELAGVIAHELAHIKNRDTLVMTVAAALGGALSLLANMAMFSSIFGSSDDEEEGGASLLGGLLAMIVAPFAAMMIQMVISRSREFIADELGAQVCGNPLALASALKKIESYAQNPEATPMQHGTPVTAHMMIVNPFTGGGLVRLFSTHPATEARVARLEAMGNGKPQTTIFQRKERYELSNV